MANWIKWAGAMAGLMVLSAPVDANAEGSDSAYYTMIKDGMDNDGIDTHTGPGNEQLASDVIKVGTDSYIVTVYMNTYTENGNYQCHCNSTKLAPGAAPEIVADVQLTDYDTGTRQCNHPDLTRVPTSVGEYAMWAYGSDAKNSNPQTFVGVLDHMCQEVVPRQKISNNDNNNEGAPDLLYSGDMNGEHYVTAGYLSTNNNDRAYQVIMKLAAVGQELDMSLVDRRSIVAPSNIGRPAIATNGQYSLFCAAKGDNRPPEDGTQCALTNSFTGEIYWKEYIQESDPGNKIYVNQPSVYHLGNGVFAVNVLISNGGGKNNNDKGSAYNKLFTIKTTDTGMQKLASIDHHGLYGAHSAICGGSYGENGEQYIALMEASITGVGPDTLQFISWDGVTKQLVDNTNMNRWIINPYNGDSGMLANITGGNPNTQGRDFMRCVGNVENPSYGLASGFKPNTKTFFLAPHAARHPDYEKNSAFMAIIPGQVDKQLQPAAPSSTEGVTGNTGDGPVDPGTTPDPAGGGATDPVFGAPETAGGCALSAPAKSGAGWWALAAGLGLIAVARRRREEV